MNTPPAMIAAAMAGNAVATATRSGDRSGSYSGREASAAASSRSASTCPSSSARCSRTSCSRASSSDGVIGISPPHAAGADGQCRRELLPRVEADDLAAEGGGRPHDVAALLAPQEGADEDRHAGGEQEPQLPRFPP